MDHWTTPPADVRVRFGVFDFDVRSLELWKNGRLVPLRPQPLKLLGLLVTRAGELVSRDEIQGALWSGDTFVDFEQGVNHAVKELRAALGDVAGSPRFIQTLPRRGYRFLAAVEPLRWNGSSPPAKTPLTGESENHRAATSAPAASNVSFLPGPAPELSAPHLPTASVPRRRWRWIVAGVAALALLVVTTALLPWRANGAAEAPGPVALSVRPFVTSADDPISGEGLAHAISSRLAGQHVSLVRPEDGLTPGDGHQRSSAATHVLSGAITRGREGLSIAARLDGPRGDRLWEETFRVRPDQILDSEAVIAERVAGLLCLRLAATDQERLRRRYTSNHAAYEEYLRGRASLVAYTPEGTKAAIRLFEGALAHDPGYALARAGLAMAAADMYLRFAPPGDVELWGARAETEARAALDLDDALAEAHLARAAVARKREFDWKTTIEASRRALVLNPNLEPAHLFMAAAYYHLGYMEEARIALERGRRLRGPDMVEPLRIEALIALFSGDFAPARARLEEVSRLSSQGIADTYLALAYYYSGSADRGRAMLEALAVTSSASTAARAGVVLAGVLAAQGDTAAAREQLERVMRQKYRDHHVAYGFGAAYAQLGDHHQAARWLRIAADTGFPCVPFFERDPLLEPLRARRQYADLLLYVQGRRDAALWNAEPWAMAIDALGGNSPARAPGRAGPH